MAVPADQEVSFRLWPPSDSTRALLVEKMATNLASISFFSVKYGRIDKAEAAQQAKRIEEEAFVVAQQQECESDSATVQMYAKQASRLMLEALKAAGKRVLRKVSLTFRILIVPETFFDISGGKRAFLNKTEAQEILKPLTEAGNAYSKICLSNWSFGKDAGLVAQEILSGIKGNLLDVNLADIVAGRPEVEALEVMAMFSESLAGSKLKSLNLSDNALGEKGVRAFSALLKSQRSLQALYFMNNGISEEAARAICELLPSGQDLRTLHFHNNMSGDAGAQALASLVEKATLLEDFQFSSTRVATEGGVALCQALQAGKSLRRIDIRDNMFGPQVGIALSKTLTLHPDLVEVYLGDIGMEDEGVTALAKALTGCLPNLRVLDLGGNEIGPKSAPFLADCIKTKQALISLNLAENELKDKGAVIICGAIKEGHTSLKELDLSSNELTRVGAVAAAEAVANKSAFTKLNLDGNRISEAGIVALKEALDNGSAGQKVLASLDDNGEEDDGEDEDDEEEDEDDDDADDLGMDRLKV
ncbi:hypothetical protein AXG93_1543s1190 [Marchantia polymorpha subsp. ruderalis]|uniref:WPP domain-containing protein n=1 Tax=Marchantia polymorpha subsp. ruderalis TaxID=1480154 RepID=A0A176VYM4_MARPO|nr:hypothetical protein AXG93_1543s1190 [Marchantia polymorpha subsp. ruderalis]